MHIVRSVGGQENCRPTQILRLTPASRRDTAQDLGAALLVLPKGLGIGGGEVARCPSASRWRAKAWDRKNTDFRFRSMTASQSSSVKSMLSARRMVPALLTRISA